VVEGFQRSMPDAAIIVFGNGLNDQTASLAMVDGDASYDPATAPAMVAEVLDNGVDMVVARRVSDGSAFPGGHTIGNQLLTVVFQRLFRLRLTDTLSGYRASSRRFVKTFPVLTRGFEVETDLDAHAARLDLRHAEIESAYTSRPTGSHSKLGTWRDGVLCRTRTPTSETLARLGGRPRQQSSPTTSSLGRGSDQLPDHLAVHFAALFTIRDVTREWSVQERQSGCTQLLWRCRRIDGGHAVAYIGCERCHLRGVVEQERPSPSENGRHCTVIAHRDDQLARPHEIDHVSGSGSHDLGRHAHRCGNSLVDGVVVFAVPGHETDIEPGRRCDVVDGGGPASNLRRRRSWLFGQSALRRRVQRSK